MEFFPDWLPSAINLEVALYVGHYKPIITNREKFSQGKSAIT
jgi:hypothetical protein